MSEGRKFFFCPPGRIRFCPRGRTDKRRGRKRKREKHLIIENRGRAPN